MINKFSIFKTFLSLLILIIHFEVGYAQTASILPNAKTTYVDQNGKPLTSGTVEFFIPGTSTHKLTWQDAGQSVPNTNPVVLDSAGRAIIFGDGSYRQLLKDRYSNIIWDGITSSAGSSGGGTTSTVGDGDAVGTVKAWSGFIAPYGYAFTYGQELVRTSYPEAFDALTSEQNVSCTSGSPTLTGVGATTQLPIGSPIESSCLNAGATIISKTVSTVVASSNAIISTTTTARFFPFGNGDGSSTFNIPDLRGRVIAGNNIMGGVASSRLTSTYFGTPADALGANGGSQNTTIARNQLPNVSTTFTGTPMTTTTPMANVVTASSTTNLNVAIGSSGTFGLISPAIGTSFPTNSFTPAGVISSINGGVTQLGLGLIQPTQTQNYIIKIVPDSNPNSFFGVASIGGMYGVISCGVGLTCSGNTIDAVSSTFNYPEVISSSSSVINVTSADQVIAINRVSPASTTINLPSVAGRNLVPLKILDWSNPLTTNIITINANGSETIFRLPAWTVYSTSSSRAMIILYPSITLNGWYIQ